MPIPKIKTKTALFLLFVIVITGGMVVKLTASQAIPVIVDKNVQLLYENKGNLKGKFIFSLRTYRPIEKLDPKMKSYLVTLSDEGKILFNSASTSGWDEKFFKYNFSPLDKNTFAYFGGTFDDAISNRASVYFMNKNYEEILSVTAPKNEPDLDGQDIYKSADGHIFYLFEKRNVSGRIFDNEIQERDVNGNIIFSWNAQKSFAESFKDQVLDESEPFQLNSISVDKDKNIVASLKRLHQIIKIQYPTGKILWRIRHEDWTFKNDSLGGYKQQHNVHLLPNGNLLMFDIGDRSTRPSRAIEYKIDTENKILDTVWEYRLTGALAMRESEGSVQRLSNGNTLIGWGRPNNNKTNLSDTIFTEVTPNGKMARELKTNSPVVAYRVYFEEEI
jgi:hypothetical protein